MLQPIFRGWGTRREESDPRFEDLELELDVTSMERSNEAIKQKRAMETFEIVSKTAPTMPMAPWVDWKALLAIVGDGLDQPRLADIIDYQALQQFQQMQQQMQQEAQMMQSMDRQGLPPGQSAPGTEISGPSLGGKVGLQPRTAEAHAAAMQDREARFG